jgi:hypothetical protein
MRSEGVQYQSERCYPDLLDLESALERIGKKGISSGNLYQDFRASFEWFRIVNSFCWSHGKHNFKPASMVKTIAEGFVGRALAEDAFIAAVRVKGLETRNDQKFPSLEIKVPDFSKVENALPLWEAHVQRVQQGQPN